MMNHFLKPVIFFLASLGSVYAEPLKVVIVAPAFGSPIVDDFNDLTGFGYFTTFENPSDEWYTNDEFPRVNYDIEKIKSHLSGLLDGSVEYQNSEVTVLQGFKSLNQLHHAYTDTLFGYTDNNTLKGNQYDVAILINDPSMLTIVPPYAFEGVSHLSSRLLAKGTDVYLLEPDHETFKVNTKELVHRIANGCGIEVIPAGETLRQSAYLDDRFGSEASYVMSGSIFSTVTGLGVSSGSDYETDSLDTAALENDILGVIASEKVLEHYTTSYNGQDRVIHRPVDLTQAPFNGTFAFTRTGTSTENQIQLSIRSLIGEHFLAGGKTPIAALHTKVSSTNKSVTSNFLPYAELPENNYLLAYGRGQTDDIGVYETDNAGNPINEVNLSNMLALPYTRHIGSSQGAPKAFDSSLGAPLYNSPAVSTVNAYENNGHRIPTHSIYARCCAFYPDSIFVFDGVHQINETIDAVAAAYVTSAAGIDFENDELNRRLYYRESDPYYIGWNTMMQQAYLSEDRGYIPDVNIDITTLSLPEASAAAPLDIALGVTGGTAPYTWEELTGNLPEGVALHQDGQLQGNAIGAGGSYQLLFKVTDANGAIHKQTLELSSTGYGLDTSRYGWDTKYSFDTQPSGSWINGQVVTALNGGASDVTVNGITFTAYDLGGGFKNAYTNGMITTGDVSYDDLLGSLSEGSGNEEVIDFTGLTAGTTYALQIFYNNKNDDGFASQIHAFIDGHSVEVELHAEQASSAGDDYGSYAVARFVASGSEVELTLRAQSEKGSIKGKAAFNALLLTLPLASEAVQPHEGVSRYAEITWTTPVKVTGLQDIISGTPLHALNGGAADISFDVLGVTFQSENIGYNNNQVTAATNALLDDDFALLMSQQTRTDYYDSMTFDGLTPGKQYQIQVFNKSKPISEYESIVNGGYHSSDTYFGLYKQGAERIYTDGEVMQSVGTFTAKSTSQVLEMHANEENPVNHISFSAIYLVEVPGYENWLAGNSDVTDTSLTGDSDNDGVVNLLEYALNGDPNTFDSGVLPSVVKSANGYLFSFERNLGSLDDTTITFQYSASLLANEWTDVELEAPEVTIGTSSNGVQLIDVMINDMEVVEEKLFGRIKVTYDE